MLTDGDLLNNNLNVERGQTRNKRQSRTSDKSYLFLIISSIVHLTFLILIVFFYSHETITGSEKKNKPLKNDPIESYFVFVKTQSGHTNTIAERDRVTTESLQSGTNSRVQNGKSAQPIANTNKMKQSQPVETASGQINLEEKVVDTKLSTAHLKNSEPSLNLNIAQLNQALRDYQIHFGEQEIQRMAKEGAAELRRQRASPSITSSASPLSPEQLDAQRRQIVVDCTNAAKRGISVISSLLGGVIECNKNLDFQQYIDKRLKKKNSTDDHQN